MNTTAIENLEQPIPKDIRSARAKLVYIWLAVLGTATADELCATLDIDKGSILAITGTLRERGYVRRTDGQYELA